MSKRKQLSHLTTIRGNASRPTDSTQCIEFMPGNDSDIFLTGGWDGVIRLYKFDISYNSELKLGGSLKLNEPILSVTWLSNTNFLISCTNGVVLGASLTNSGIEARQVAKFKVPIQKLSYQTIENKKVVFCFGLSNEIYILDIASGNTVKTINLKYNMVACDMTDKLVICGLSENKFLVDSVENLISKNGDWNYVDSELDSPISSV